MHKQYPPSRQAPGLRRGFNALILFSVEHLRYDLVLETGFTIVNWIVKTRWFKPVKGAAYAIRWRVCASGISLPLFYPSETARSVTAFA